jgi:hypothetical protein
LGSPGSHDAYRDHQAVPVQQILVTGAKITSEAHDRSQDSTDRIGFTESGFGRIIASCLVRPREMAWHEIQSFPDNFMEARHVGWSSQASVLITSKLESHPPTCGSDLSDL